MKTKCIIWGAGGHAKVVAEILRLNGLEVVGFLDGVNAGRKGTEFYGASVLGGEEALDVLLASGVTHAVAGLGNNSKRLELSAMLEGRGFRLISAVHPNAVCAADVSIGEGTVVCSGAVIGPSTVVGRNAVINTQASLDHDCLVQNGAHVGPGATVAGEVHVAECAWIGAGAVISNNRRIGAGAIVGAGAVVVKDVPEAVVVVGVPARILRKTHE